MVVVALYPVVLSGSKLTTCLTGTEPYCRRSSEVFRVTGFRPERIHGGRMPAERSWRSRSTCHEVRRRRCLVLIVLLAGIPWLGFLQAAPPRSSKNPTDLASFDALITPEDRGHWAFQPIKPPLVPQVKNTAWPRNPIDRFVVAKLEEQGWSPAPPAEPRALVRQAVPRPDRVASHARGTGNVSG